MFSAWNHLDNSATAAASAPRPTASERIRAAREARAATPTCTCGHRRICTICVLADLTSPVRD